MKTPVTPALLLLLLPLLLLLHPDGTSAQVDTSFCRETTGSETLPSLPKTNFWANLGVVQSNQISADITLFLDTEISKKSVTLRQQSGQEYRVVMDFANEQIATTDLNKGRSFDACRVENSTTDNFHVLTSVTLANSERLLVPSRRFFSGAELRIERTDTENVHGLSTQKYRSCFYWNSQATTMEVTWWFPVAGPQSPVQVQTRGRTRSGGDFSIVYSVSPLLSLQQKFHIERNPFASPPGVFCPGLISTKQASPTFSRFRLSVQQKFEWQQPDESRQMRESYDQQTQLTMLEATDVNLVLISDFERGIAYQRNSHTDTCNFTRIVGTSWDVQTEDGRIRLRHPDEFYLPSIEQLQYKAKGVYRGFDVESFIGFSPDVLDLGNGTKFSLTAEYFLTNRIKYGNQGQAITRSVPLLASYTSDLPIYNSEVEVFNFDTGVLNTDDHDISKCFDLHEKRHFELMLTVDQLEPSNAKYVTDNPDILLYSLTSTLSSSLNISPLRVIRPQVVVNQEKLLLIEVTLTERAEVPGYTPTKPEANLQDAVATLTSLADTMQLRVQINEGDVLFDVPIDAAINLDERSESKKTGTGGISAGGAVGLAFGCLFLGAVLALLVLLGVSIARGQPLLPVPGFGMRRMSESRS